MTAGDGSFLRLAPARHEPVTQRGNQHLAARAKLSGVRVKKVNPGFAAKAGEDFEQSRADIQFQMPGHTDRQAVHEVTQMLDRHWPRFDEERYAMLFGHQLMGAAACAASAAVALEGPTKGKFVWTEQARFW
ncbi:hypothetical protein [Pseudothauera hydrothermalis]|uniref:hypothetical protein n=1 Tax=Pseudothauera hydrothermalis TaxID=2184083 RepID=UPI0013C2B187|nr:hypothetical protein [Pseudothauera hydrothermalis]